MKNREECFGLSDVVISSPQYVQSKNVITISASIPIPKDIITTFYIFSCHPKYTEIAGQVRDCIFSRFPAPPKWTGEFKIKTFDLEKYLSCPAPGSAGVVEYSAPTREPHNYRGILRDICDGKKHQIEHQYFTNHPTGTDEEVKAYYLKQVANKDGTAANAGVYAWAEYEYNCHEYKIDCITNIIIETIKESGWLWGCSDAVVTKNHIIDEL